MFKKGQSGNPNGRPKIAEEFKVKCQKQMEKLFPVWCKIANDAGHKDQLRAIEAIAAYAYGKPTDSLKVEGEIKVRPVLNLGYSGLSDKSETAS